MSVQNEKLAIKLNEIFSANQSVTTTLDLLTKTITPPLKTVPLSAAAIEQITAYMDRIFPQLILEINTPYTARKILAYTPSLMYQANLILRSICKRKTIDRNNSLSLAKLFTKYCTKDKSWGAPYLYGVDFIFRLMKNKNLTEDTVLEIARKNPNNPIMAAIARRQPLTEKIINVLLDYSPTYFEYSLVANPTLVGNRVFNQLAASDNPTIRLNLAKRADAPLAALAKIYLASNSQSAARNIIGPKLDASPVGIQVFKPVAFMKLTKNLESEQQLQKVKKKLRLKIATKILVDTLPQPGVN